MRNKCSPTKMDIIVWSGNPILYNLAKDIHIDDCDDDELRYPSNWIYENSQDQLSKYLYIYIGIFHTNLRHRSKTEYWTMYCTKALMRIIHSMGRASFKLFVQKFPIREFNNSSKLSSIQRGPVLH